MALKIAPRPIPVQAAEHGAVVHVVAVDQVIGVGHIRGVPGGQVDGARQGAFLIDIVVGVIEVVRPLHDGVVDVGLVHRQPGPVVLVDLRQQVLEIHRRLVVLRLHDGGLVLQQIPAGLGLLLGVEGVVEHVTGEEDQRRCQQAGEQGQERGACAGQCAQGRGDRALAGRFPGRRRLEIISHVHFSPFLP